MLRRQMWVGTKKIGRKGGWVRFCLHQLLHKSLTTKQAKENDISKQHSKQAIRQEKVRKITKRLLTRFSSLQVKLIRLNSSN